MTIEDSKAVPFVIISRNRFSLVREAVEFGLRQSLTLKIIIADMQSTYPPLVEYLRTISSEQIQVLRLPNLGPRGLWINSQFTNVVENSGFFLTDGDLDYSMTDSICCEELISYSKKYPGMRKIGSALRIDDLDASIEKQRNVQLSESDNWNSLRKLSARAYFAPADTQLAYYPKYTENFYFWPSLRISGTCEVRHSPWYENPEARTPEEIFYMDNARWWGVGGITSHEKAEAIGKKDKESLRVLRYAWLILGILRISPRFGSLGLRLIINRANRRSYMGYDELAEFLT